MRKEVKKGSELNEIYFLIWHFHICHFGGCWCCWQRNCSDAIRRPLSASRWTIEAQTRNCPHWFGIDFESTANCLGTNRAMFSSGLPRCSPLWLNIGDIWRAECIRCRVRSAQPRGTWSAVRPEWPSSTSARRRLWSRWAQSWHLWWSIQRRMRLSKVTERKIWMKNKGQTSLPSVNWAK